MERQRSYLFRPRVSLSIVQKRSIRYIANANSNAHTDPLFHRYNIMKFHDLIQLNQATFMYKYVNGKLPPSFENIFPKLINFDRSFCFRIDGLKRSYLKTFSTHTLPKLWNNLPFELKRNESLKNFKKKLTASYFDKYSLRCLIHKCMICKN